MLCDAVLRKKDTIQLLHNIGTEGFHTKRSDFISRKEK